MRKELFLNLIKQIEDFEKEVDKLTSLLKIDVIDNQMYNTPHKMFQDIMCEEFGNDGYDTISELVYQVTPHKYSKENPYITDKDGTAIAWDHETVYDYLVSRDKKY